MKAIHKLLVPVLLVSATLPLAFGQPKISPGGIQDAANQTPGRAVAAGSFVSIYGSGLANQLAQADSIPLAKNLANVSVTFNGIVAPLQIVTGGQINAQVPWNVLTPGTNGTVNVVVNNNGASPAEPLLIGQSDPGIYGFNGWAISIDAQDPTSARYGKITAPPGAIPGLTTFPAQAGDVLIVYASGLGPVTPTIADGAASVDVTRFCVNTVNVSIGGVPAKVPFAGLSTFVAVYQMNLVVPQIPANNAAPMVIQVLGINSPSANIAVQ